jgi:hypothetical protein
MVKHVDAAELRVVVAAVLAVAADAVLVAQQLLILSALAPMNLRRARVVGRSFSAGAQPPTHVCTVGACGKK